MFNNNYYNEIMTKTNEKSTIEKFGEYWDKLPTEFKVVIYGSFASSLFLTQRYFAGESIDADMIRNIANVFAYNILGVFLLKVNSRLGNIKNG